MYIHLHIIRCERLMPPLKLLFIRHAQSKGNVEKRMQGHGEYELTPLGQEQAARLGQRLLQENWCPTQVYTSPLQRAVQTMEILLQAFPSEPLPGIIGDLTDVDTPLTPVVSRPIPVAAVPELAEYQNGIFQGLTWPEAQARYPELCHQLEQTPDWIPIPGGETLEAARDRARQFIQMLLEHHSNGDQLWIVSHSWIIQHLIAELLGCDRSWRLRAHNTALFEFWIDHSRWHRQDHSRFNTDLWQIRRFNDDQHLHL
jgi:2,3-bisphosphoglycerate-dependent phosphoglycerate mutase